MNLDYLLSTLVESYNANKSFVFLILGFYIGIIVMKVFSYYEKKSSEKIKRPELDYQTKLPSQKKVYAIVKEIYKELNEQTNSKEFNLTEALFLLRNSSEYNFFTTENSKIIFERKIEIINENENNIDINHKNEINIENLSELEIKNIVKNFKLPKEKEKEMILSVLDGSSYIYPIMKGLTAVFLNIGVNFIRNGNRTITDDWGVIRYAHPYTDIYTIVEEVSGDGKIVKNFKLKSSSQEMVIDNEILRTNIEEIKSLSIKEKESMKHSEVVDVLNLDKTENIREEIKKKENVETKTIKENKLFLKKELSNIFNFFEKSYWSDCGNFEKELFIKLLSNYVPVINFIFYKTNTKKTYLFIDIELLAVLIDSVANINDFKKKYYRVRREKEFFKSSVIESEESFALLESIISENFENISLAKNTSEMNTTIKYFVSSDKNKTFYEIKCIKFKINEDIINSLNSIKEIPLYNPTGFINDSRHDELLDKEIVYDYNRNNLVAGKHDD